MLITPKPARVVFKLHFTVGFLFPVAISCSSDLIFLQRIMNVSSHSCLFPCSSSSLSETKLAKHSQTLPPFLAGSAASACISRYCSQRARDKQNKTQPAATSGIFRSFHHNPAGTRFSPQVGRRPQDPISALISFTNRNVFTFWFLDSTTQQPWCRVLCLMLVNDVCQTSTTRRRDDH